MYAGIPTITTPIWKTIDGVIYMFESGAPRYLKIRPPLEEPGKKDQVVLVEGQHQIGYSNRYDEYGRLDTGHFTQKWQDAHTIEYNGSNESDSVRLAKDVHGIAYGGGGHDTIKGGRLSDEIYGGDGNDYVRGGGGDDHVYGEEGNDRVTGAGGNDKLWGGNGHDFLYGGKGVDVMYGGSGLDVFYLKLANKVDMQDFESATDSVDAIMDFEQGSDRIRLKSGAEVFYQHVTINGEIYTFIFNNDQGDGEAYGVIHNQHVDLSKRDFENAGRVAKLDPAIFNSVPDVGETHFDGFDPAFLTLASFGVSEVM